MTYWDGDRAEAEAAVRLACDLLPIRSDIVSLAFIQRFDAQPPSIETTTHAREKFKNVIVWKCTRIGVGFPMGCNELAYGIFSWLVQEKELFQDTEAVLILEGDCVFTRANWDVELLEEWERTKAEGKLIAGHFLNHGHEGYDKHVNATALYHRDILKHLPSLIGGPGQVGWDYSQGRNIVPVARDSPLIFLDYRKWGIQPHELFSPRKCGLVPLIYHGVKDDSARNAVIQSLNAHPQ